MCEPHQAAQQGGNKRGCRVRGGLLFHNMREWGRQWKPETHVRVAESFSSVCVCVGVCKEFTHTHTLISTVKKTSRRLKDKADGRNAGITLIAVSHESSQMNTSGTQTH